MIMKKNFKETLKHHAKQEGKKALLYYLLKWLGKHSHKSYFHRRAYYLLRDFLNQKLR